MANYFNAKAILIPDITHSLDDAKPEQIDHYYRILKDWLKANI